MCLKLFNISMCFNCLVKQNYFEAQAIYFKVFEKELSKQIVNTSPKHLLQKDRPINELLDKKSTVKSVLSGILHKRQKLSINELLDK